MTQWRPVIILLACLLLPRNLSAATQVVYVVPSLTDGANNTAVNPANAYDNGNVATDSTYANIGYDTANSIDFRNLWVGTVGQPNLGAISKVELVVVHSQEIAPYSPLQVRAAWMNTFDLSSGTPRNLTVTSPTSITESFDVTGERAAWAFSDFNSLEIHVFTPDPPPPDQYLSYRVYETYFRVTYNSFQSTGAVTLDTDSNGKLDGLEIFFPNGIDDATLCQGGFAVGNYSNVVLVSTGLPGYPRAPNDPAIFLRFSEDQTVAGDTGNIPAVSYSTAAGCQIADISGDLLSPGPILPVADGAGPVLISAQADSGGVPGGGGGIKTGNQVVLAFSEATNKPTINSGNINTILSPIPSPSNWLSGDGSLVSATWNSGGDLLTVTLSTSGGAPVLAPGLTSIQAFSASPTQITDAAGNLSTGTILLGGSFTADVPPQLLSRETVDLNADGLLDAIRLVFSGPICDASVSTANFTVQEVHPLSFQIPLLAYQAVPPGSGRSPNSNTLYLLFKETSTVATDNIPWVAYHQGSLVNYNGSGCGTGFVPNSSLTPSVDKAPPVPLSAVAADGFPPRPGPDADDFITITFSEATNRPVINAANIGSVLPLIPSTHTWGFVDSNWTNAKTLVVNFNGNVSSSTLRVGDTVRASGGNTLLDLALNSATGTVTLTGSFTGVDPVPPAVSSSTPANGAIGVSLSPQITVSFSKYLDASSAQAAVTLRAIQNKDGGAINTPVPGLAVYNGITSITFLPNAPLSPNVTYSLDVSTLAKSSTLVPLSAPASVHFTTVLNNAVSNTVIAPGGAASIFLPPLALPTSGYLQISTSPVSQPLRVNPSNILTANAKVLQNPGRFVGVLTSSLLEINSFSSSGQTLGGALGAPATLTIPYPATDAKGFLIGVTPMLRADTLRVFWLDESHALWTQVAGSIVNTVSRTVIAPINHFSVYGLLSVADTGLSDAYAFPVPFIPSRGDAAITFTNLSPTANIRIFTLSGELVRSLDNGGGQTLAWDAKNDRGQAVASGTYLYVISNGASTKKGKLMVIR